MVLTVAFDEFPEAARRAASTKEVYISPHGKGTFLTAADSRHDIIVAASTQLGPIGVKAQLEAAGLTVFEGAWSAYTASRNGAARFEAYVAAVAYSSRELSPGLWVDAFATTPQIVLRAMYDEFRENDEIGDVSYEDFIKYAHPNVVILGPGEIDTYLQQKEEC